MFSGMNGVGKTNTLEALWVLATTRSFRTADDRDLVSWGEAATRVSGGDWEFAFALEPIVQKQVSLQGVATAISAYVGTLRAVLFTPQSLELLLGTPATRRKFLNHLFLQLDRTAAPLLVAYQRALKQRNSLLKQRGVRDDLGVWDEEVAEFGAQITSARAQLIVELDERLEACFEPWNPRGYQVHLSYQPSGSPNQADYLDQLGRYRSLDERFGTTTHGPHRDDFELVLNDRPAGRFASRGEQRSLVLALQGAAVDLLTLDGRRPLLLLDDVFSELDPFHREALVQLTATTQTVLTTTETDLHRIFDASRVVHHVLPEGGLDARA